MLGFDFGFASLAVAGRRGGGPLAPEALPGILAVFDFTRTDTLFQDNLGTAGVTAAGQSVGLVLDTRHTLGPELLANPDFATDFSGWNLMPGGGVTATREAGGARVIQDGTSNAGIVSDMAAAEMDALYRVTCDLTENAGNTAAIELVASNGVPAGGIFRFAPGAYQLIAPANSTQMGVRVRNQNVVASNRLVGSLSMRKIGGPYLRQATASKRPVYHLAGLADDGIDDALTPSLSGTLSAAWAAGGALIYAEGVAMGAAYDVLRDGMTGLAITSGPIAPTDRARLAQYWGVAP